MRFGEITPSACNALIWSMEDERVLLLLRSESSTDPLTWCLPGGHVEAGESWQEALDREIIEEIGRNLSDLPRCLLTSSHTEEPAFDHRNYAVCVDKTFKPRLNWEHNDYKWCSLDELPENCNWGVNMLLSNDEAAVRLREFQKKCKKIT